MKPVKTVNSSVVYRGGGDTQDLNCDREAVGIDGRVFFAVSSVWEPSEEERRAIAEGANIKLYIYNEPIPPVGIGITNEEVVR